MYKGVEAERTGKIIDLTIRLGDFPSVSGHEEAITKFAASRLRKINQVKVHSVGGGIIAFLPGEGDHTSVLVGIAHLDQVPISGGIGRLVAGEDRIVGPGAGDNKVGIATAIVDLEYPTETDRIVVLSPEEELDEKSEGRGAIVQNEWLEKRLLKRYDPTRRGGINFEPTYRDGNDGFVGFGHRGGEVFQMTAEGPVLHAGSNSRGKGTAASKIGKLLHELDDIQDEWTRKYSDEFGEPTINVVGMEANVAMNVVSGTANVLLAVRSTNSFNDEWNTTIRPYLEEEYSVSITPKTSPHLAVSTCDPRSGIYQTMAAIELPMEVFPFSSDQGAFSFPVIHYGPGNIEDIHTVNDSVNYSAINEVGRNLIKVQQIFPAYESVL